MKDFLARKMTDVLLPEGVVLYSIFDDADDFGLMYTCGGKREFFVDDVPKDKTLDVGGLLLYCLREESEGKHFHTGQTVSCNALVLVAIKLRGSNLHDVLKFKCCHCSMDAEVFLLVPHFMDDPWNYKKLTPTELSDSWKIGLHEAFAVFDQEKKVDSEILARMTAENMTQSCPICYEEMELLVPPPCYGCAHALCKSCWYKIPTQNCPICQRQLAPWLDEM